jgi:hypothetical protein
MSRFLAGNNAFGTVMTLAIVTRYVVSVTTEIILTQLTPFKVNERISRPVTWWTKNMIAIGTSLSVVAVDTKVETT